MKVTRLQLREVVRNVIKEFMGAMGGVGGASRQAPKSAYSQRRQADSQMVRNPQTGKSITIKSAMSYPKDSQVYRAAMRAKRNYQEDGDTEVDVAGELNEAKQPRIEKLRKIVDNHQAMKIDGHMVDAFTASGLVKLYDAIRPDLQKKFETLKLPVLVDFMWKQMKR